MTSAPKAIPTERQIIRSIWMILVASVVGLFPFTILSTFLVPIGQDAGTSPAAVGALRGAGALAALGAGIVCTFLINRIEKRTLTAAALFGLSAACVIGTHGSHLALLVFCIGVGAATAILTPALLSAAADRFSDLAASGRAATLVTATASLAAVLAAPVIAVMALWNGWRGALLVTAGVAALLALGFLRTVTSANATESSGDRLDYWDSLRAVLREPRLVRLIAIAMLRTAAFMGYLAYLAILYDDRFGLDARTFTLVWTLSGLSFFVGNFLAGRWAGLADASTGSIRGMLIWGLLGALLGVIAVFHAPTLLLALASTAVIAVSHAVVAAAVVTLLVRDSGAARSSTMAVNAVGMSFGVFAGAAVGGAGLALAGYSGIAVALGSLVVAALVLAWR